MNHSKKDRGVTINYSPSHEGTSGSFHFTYYFWHMSPRKPLSEEFIQHRKSFGKVLTRIRKEKGLTQTELATAANLSLRMISDMECGYLQPTLITLFKLAKGLQMDTMNLIEQMVIEVENKQ